MRKRTQINYSVAQRYIGSPVESTGAGSSIRITRAGVSTSIAMTLQEIRRFFHFGYAFNLRQLKYFEFGSSFVIGSVDAAEFVRNVRQVKELVIHAETQALCDKVLSAFPDPHAEYVIGVSVEAR